jgi:hypothetical protein
MCSRRVPQLLDPDDHMSGPAWVWISAASLTATCLRGQDGEVTTAPADDAERSDEEERRQMTAPADDAERSDEEERRQ